MTRKRFGISLSLNQGLSETINAVENHAGAVRFEVIALSRIEPDPNNPRELTLSPDDIRQGIPKEAIEKHLDYEKLQSLAETIKRKGLLNPVVVYKYGEKYRLVAGERRLLASLIAGKNDIQARVLGEKPQAMDLRLLQWIENTEREDLSLKERMGNVRAILSEYQKQHPHAKITATLLKELIGISLPQASCYLSVLNAPADLEEFIAQGKINNLDKAAVIAKVNSHEIRIKALLACANGYNIKQLRTLIQIEEKAQREQHNASSNRRGRAAKQVMLGTTHKTEVIRIIINSVLREAKYKIYAELFAKISWKNYHQVTQAFRKLIEILENK